MARVDNSVKILCKVIKGPYEYHTKEGNKLRVSYQVEIPSRNKDKGVTSTPWVRSVGNQAEKDLANIKTGDMIIVNGRIVTRKENKNHFIVTDPEDESKMIVIDPEDEECPDYDDSEIKQITIERQVTEILADDVWYFHKFLEFLTDSEKKRLFTEKVLLSVERALKEQQEENQSLYLPDEE